MTILAPNVHIGSCILVMELLLYLFSFLGFFVINLPNCDMVRYIEPETDNTMVLSVSDRTYLDFF